MQRLLIGLLFAMVLAVPPAYAGMVSTDDAASGAQAAQERERVKMLVARPEVARQLEKMGIAPQEAVARVDAMSDAEVRNLAGRLEALPAGGALSNTDLLLVIIIVLLVLLVV